MNAVSPLWEPTCSRRRWIRRAVFGACTGPFASKLACVFDQGKVWGERGGWQADKSRCLEHVWEPSCHPLFPLWLKARTVD
ncbi:hypothetical protein BKC06_003520 [Pseudomonas syringae pv. syringae]|nr:hypothetical protein BKC06_003520 [Pseudomonas syringae pv. syringae]